jgi:hypothetical protein
VIEDAHAGHLLGVGGHEANIVEVDMREDELTPHEADQAAIRAMRPPAAAICAHISLLIGKVRQR